MDLQSCGPDEALVASIAVVGLLSSVSSDMIIQSSSGSESLITIVAWVRFTVAMNSLMNSQI